MKKVLLSILSFGMLATTVTAQDQLPSNPQPGKCYVKCVTPDEYKTETVKIQTKAGYNTLKVVPATFKTVTEKILVKPASKKFIAHPAVFENYTETYESQAPSNSLKVIPATFKTGTEKIEIQPVTNGWEYGTYSDCKSSDPRDCRVLCFKEYPAVSTTVTTTNVDKDASTTSVNIPGKTSTITKQKIAKPAYVEEVAIPAQYKTITKRVVDKPASTTSVSVDAQFRTITKQVMTKKGGVTVWEEVDCKLTTNNILPIYYELGSARLTSASKSVIDNKLLSLLNSKKNIRIELNSHTDSRGAASSNQALSQARANSVVNYLVSKGISKSRLVANGYGESRLKNNCSDGVKCTEAQHQQNRRTEFRVIGY